MLLACCRACLSSPCLALSSVGRSATSRPPTDRRHMERGIRHERAVRDGLPLACKAAHRPQNGPESPTLCRYFVAASGSRLR